MSGPVTPLQRLANLTELHFTDTAVSDLSPLSDLDDLFRLTGEEVLQYVTELQH